MADLTYDPDSPARKPRPIASSPFWTGDATPGLRFTPRPDPAPPGLNYTPAQIPTPMGWLSPDMAGRMLNNLAPSRDARKAACSATPSLPFACRWGPKVATAGLLPGSPRGPTIR
jgi:hypothetical protein